MLFVPLFRHSYQTLARHDLTVFIGRKFCARTIDKTEIFNTGVRPGSETLTDLESTFWLIDFSTNQQKHLSQLCNILAKFKVLGLGTVSLYHTYYVWSRRRYLNLFSLQDTILHQKCTQHPFYYSSLGLFFLISSRPSPFLSWALTSQRHQPICTAGTGVLWCLACRAHFFRLRLLETLSLRDGIQVSDIVKEPKLCLKWEFIIAHEQFLAYAESNLGLLKQIFTKRTLFHWASRPQPAGHLKALHTLNRTHCQLKICVKRCN